MLRPYPQRSRKSLPRTREMIMGLSIHETVGAQHAAPLHQSAVRILPIASEIYADFFVGRSSDRRSSRSCVTAERTVSVISRS